MATYNSGEEATWKSTDSEWSSGSYVIPQPRNMEARDGSSNFGGSTIEYQNQFPQWNPPEAGLEVSQENTFPTLEKQSVVPEWRQQEPGLQIGKQNNQPYSEEKIPAKTEKKIWGLRPRIFWVILGSIAVLVVALALGLGLGLTLRGKASDTATSSTSPTVTVTVTPTLTTATASSTTTSGADPSPTLNAMPACPGANGTTYTDPVTKVQFTRECGISHDGSDISNHDAYSMDDCVTSCAQLSECNGAVWFNDGEQGTLLNYCWLKSKMNTGTSIRYNNDAQSATRV